LGDYLTNQAGHPARERAADKPKIFPEQFFDNFLAQTWIFVNYGLAKNW
jgi:hypothetical protein